MTTRTIALLVLSCGLLSGCVGNQTAYRPGWEPVPENVTVQDEHEREMARRVPMEIARHDWFLHHGREEVRRIRANVSHNPWRSYERDMAKTLGASAGEYLRRDPSAILAEPEVDPDDEEDEGEDGGGDEDDWGDEGDDEGGEDDWGEDDW